MFADKKYTVNVAYTTPSGRMHIGHGLGHTISDVALRYGALRRGEGTFFGFGMHSTGKDLIKILNNLRQTENLPETLEKYNISPKKRGEILSAGELPQQIDALVQEYRGQYQKVLEGMGIAMDYESFFSTNQEANQKYTQWTLRKLDEAGLIVETESDRPYCPKCDDIKHIDKDLSEVSATGIVNWEEVRILDGQIQGGEFECRLHSGERIVVRKRKERAINYADPEMQQRTIELAKKMEVFPRKYKRDIEEIVRTRLAKPFERKAGENVGAISPFDPEKRVEALSDSNIYMEFYGIAQLINQGKLKTENLNDSFFDYIYLEKGDAHTTARISGITESVLEEVKQQMDKTYPVDVSIAGFEHLGVHVPFSLFTHAAVLPKRFFFPEYIVTSHITRDGEKMSKSKGNVVYLDELLELTRTEGELDDLTGEASLDAVRFFLSYYQSLDKDFDWNDDNFRLAGIKGMKRYVTGIVEGAKQLGGLEEKTVSPKDKWFSTVDQRTIKEITGKMDEKDSRGALVSLVDVRGKAMYSYLIGDNPNPTTLSRFLLNQLNMGYPVMPRVTGELRDKYFPKTQLEWPKQEGSLEFPEEYEVFEHQLKGKEYERNLLGEVNATLGKMLGKREISLGEKAIIIVPTEHQMSVLQSRAIPLSKRINLTFSLDPTLNNMEIRRER